MKTKFYLTFLIGLFLTATSIQAQSFSTATEALRFFETNAQEIVTITNAQAGRLNAALSGLRNGNQNLFTSKLSEAIAVQDRVEELSDELNTGAFQASQLDPAASNSTLLNAGVNIEGLQDGVVNNINAAIAANNTGDTASAIASLETAIDLLNQQNSIAKEAIDVSRAVRKSL